MTQSSGGFPEAIPATTKAIAAAIISRRAPFELRNIVGSPIPAAPIAADPAVPPDTTMISAGPTPVTSSDVARNRLAH
jgi:hypothetical protein